jgi:hypothetical protein
MQAASWVEVVVAAMAVRCDSGEELNVTFDL